MKSDKAKLFLEVGATIQALNMQAIPAERKIVLQPLIEFIRLRVLNHQEVRINFICTHNSRRSHLAQVWAQTMAFYFNVKSVFCYSGGTETTALFPMVVETLRNSGFQIKRVSKSDNPVYRIKFSANEQPIIGFSKTFDDGFNPKSDFAAVMTCDSANESCPMVLGAETRIPITYDDPKSFDNTAQQVEKYLETSVQIATELYYVFSQISSK